MKKFFFIIIIIFIFLFPLASEAQEILGSSTNFYIQSSYDASKREEIEAILLKISSRGYWYFDIEQWNSLNDSEKDEATTALNSLADEFDSKIYPVLTNKFGSEWNPGIDKDSRVTILMHSMVAEAGGYFNSADEYLKSQIQKSNEREMIYLTPFILQGQRPKAF